MTLGAKEYKQWKKSPLTLILILSDPLEYFISPTSINLASEGLDTLVSIEQAHFFQGVRVLLSYKPWLLSNYSMLFMSSVQGKSIALTILVAPLTQIIGVRFSCSYTVGIGANMDVWHQSGPFGISYPVFSVNKHV